LYEDLYYIPLNTAAAAKAAVVAGVNPISGIDGFSAVALSLVRQAGILNRIGNVSNGAELRLTSCRFGDNGVIDLNTGEIGEVAGSIGDHEGFRRHQRNPRPRKVIDGRDSRPRIKVVRVQLGQRVL
jgi:hypothetical protein